MQSSALASWFLSLDEAIASRAAFASYPGRTGGNAFGVKLNDTKTVRDRPYVSMLS